jgi:TctA family transporter
MAGPRPSFALAFVAYTALRLLLFLVPLAVIYALSGNALVSAVLAAIIGFALSMILLDRQRGSVALMLRNRAESRRIVSDETAEDGLTDEVGDQNDSAAANPRP